MTIQWSFFLEHRPLLWTPKTFGALSPPVQDTCDHDTNIIETYFPLNSDFVFQEFHPEMIMMSFPNLMMNEDSGRMPRYNRKCLYTVTYMRLTGVSERRLFSVFPYPFKFSCFGSIRVQPAERKMKLAFFFESTSVVSPCRKSNPYRTFHIA